MKFFSSWIHKLELQWLAQFLWIFQGLCWSSFYGSFIC
jgi:hypothetical protein